ncbi:hypothetical protein V1477_004315 [Vespula maculifrons]|uniref:Uncharacterized protein n=1 Tax=Vespula maculifrons TaxID=7453 RepID=A0ABD2CR84_VESMC
MTKKLEENKEKKEEEVRLVARKRLLEDKRDKSPVGLLVLFSGDDTQTQREYFRYTRSYGVNPQFSDANVGGSVAVAVDSYLHATLVALATTAAAAVAAASVVSEALALATLALAATSHRVSTFKVAFTRLRADFVGEFCAINEHLANDENLYKDYY